MAAGNCHRFFFVLLSLHTLVIRVTGEQTNREGTK
jgi:hypothetical protein